MKFRRGNSNGYSNVPSSSSVESGNSRKRQTAMEGEQILGLETSASSNADTIMDLATPVSNATRSNGSASKVVYRLEGIDEKKIMSEEDEVERIVSGVTKGLRKSSRTKSSRPHRPPKATPVPTLSPTLTANTNTNTNTSDAELSAALAMQSSLKQQQQGVPTSKERSSNRRSSGSNNNSNNKSKSRLARRIGSKKVAAVQVVSDDESSRIDQRHRQQKSSDQGLHERLHHMMFDESVDTSAFSSNADDTVDYDYNYIDDESYGNTSSSSSSSSGSSYSSDSSASESRRGIHHERNYGGDTVDDSVTASLSIDVESSFGTERSGSMDDSRALHEYEHKVGESQSQSESQYDDHQRESEFRYHNQRGGSPPPQGLDIVARLLSGAKEISLDASSITNKGSSSGKSTPVHEVARHLSDALAQTTSLQKLSFCGMWKGESSKLRLVLEILFDGLLENTSVHTIILRDNFAFDRYAGYAFGTLLKAHSHGRLQTLEILHCKFVGSGWNSLLMGLQHSSSIKKLYIEDFKNLSSEDIDGITSTIQYLNIESLRLRKVKLHKVHIENLSFLLRAIQQTKTLKEVDLSGNSLGSTPGAIQLLSKCLSGDPVWVRGGGDSDDDRLPSNYQHHIEKLMLYDCGITEKSSIRTLVMALDSTLTMLDVNNNEMPLVLHTLDLSQNQFGNSGARIVEKLLEGNPLITTLGMVGCGVGASHLKTVSDRLRYNNSFLQKIGLSSGVSLAILDSVSAVEHVFAGGARKAVSGAGVGSGAGTTNVAMDGEDSDIEENARLSGCGTC
jgi:Ran GTPase-activating protein (RanGAP) involved in mRNA processing and transport